MNEICLDVYKRQAKPGVAFKIGCVMPNAANNGGSATKTSTGETNNK